MALGLHRLEPQPEPGNVLTRDYRSRSNLSRHGCCYVAGHTGERKHVGEERRAQRVRTRSDTMAESLTMTRGQLHDLLARFAVENPKYREALINDPKMVLEKQLGSSLGNVTVKSVIETPDTMYVVVPYVQKEGELSDADLENVAGGMLNNLMA